MASYNWPPTGGGGNAFGSIELDGSVSGSLILTVPSVVTSYTLVFPAAQGAANTTLVNDGSGNLSWGAVDQMTIGTYDGHTPVANGLQIISDVLFAQSADATHPGMVSTGTQTIAGAKTFTGAISASNLSGTNTGDVTLGAVGASGNANGASLSGQVLNLQPASASFPGALTAADWTTFNSKQAALTIGNLTDAGTDGIVVTGGTGAIIGSGVSLAQHVADTTHNGYLSSTDWNTFNGKQASGNYITALTGDVTASGPGSVAATIAANAVTNAKLATMATNTVKANITGGSAVPTDVAFVSTNTNSSGVFRDSSGNFSAGTITASLTGHSSLDLALAGGTMTGAFINSFAGAASSGAMAITGAPYAAGTATTNKPQVLIENSGTSTGWSTGGCYLGINAPAAFAGRLFDMQIDGVTKQYVGVDGQTVYTNSTENVTVGMSSSSRFTMNNTAHATSVFYTYATNTGFTGLGNGTFGNNWLVATTLSSTNTSPLTTLVPGSTNPVMDIRNTSSTANNYAALVFSGSTDKLMAGIYCINKVHTAASETGELHFCTNNAASKADVMVLGSAGLLQLNAYTTAGVLVNDASGNVTDVAPSTSGNVLTSNGSAWVSQAPAAAPTLYYWSGYQLNTSAWTWTGTSFADPTALSVGDVVQVYNSNMTVTAYKSGSNFFPGIKFTPDTNTSAYLVTVTVQAGGTAASDTSMRLWDGTTTLDWQSMRNVTGDYGPAIKFSAIFAPASSSQQTLSIQGAISSGTLTVQSNGQVASQPSVRWTIQKIT